MILDPHTVEVRSLDGSVRRLTAKHILVATGGHAVKIPIPGAVSAARGEHHYLMLISRPRRRWAHRRPAPGHAPLFASPRCTE